MRGAGMRSRAVVGLAGALLVAGCSAAPNVSGPAVPTFAPGGGAAGAAAATAPLDPCAALISPEDVAGVLGLEAGKVNVRTVRGQPAPTVGRTERLDCSYRADKGQDLFDIRMATYADTVSAGQQWMLNMGREDGDRRPVTVGTASGSVFSRKGEQLLSVLWGNRTFALELPDRTAPKGRAKENLIVDFAQRALKVDPATPATPAPATTAPGTTG